MGLKIVLRSCDTYVMKRTGAIALLTTVVVVVFLLVANSLIGGGTVRSPLPASASATTAAHEVAANVGGKSGKEGSGKDGGAGSDGGTSAGADGVTFAAVGDTMLGNTPELPSDPGSYLDQGKGHRPG